MAILGQIAGTNALLSGATGLVNAVRRPKLNSADFKNVLQERMRLQNDPNVLHQRAEKARNEADSAARQFMKLRDHDNNQLLSRDESGMEAAAFTQMDANRDGSLTLDEIKKPQLDAIGRMFPNG